MAPRGPQKGQKSILMGSLVVLDPNASPKKISSIFGTGCHKACTCPLNGASCYTLDIAIVCTILLYIINHPYLHSNLTSLLAHQSHIPTCTAITHPNTCIHTYIHNTQGS